MRNIDCSEVIQFFGPCFCPVVLYLACMKYFIILEAVKNRCIVSLFVDLSHKIFGSVMMLLPRLNTMFGSSHSLDQEKKASGIKDMQPILVANGIFVNFENSRHPLFQGISPLGRGILKKKINRDTNHFNEEYCDIYLL